MLRLTSKSRQLVSPPTAAQGFSPGLSADGSLIYSRGGPLRKQIACASVQLHPFKLFFNHVKAL